METDDRVNRAVVLAPVNGILEKLSFITVGSFVPAGTPIAQIALENDQLLIEANVSPADIDQIKVGQKARIMFSSLNENVLPEPTGEVIYVAADSSFAQEGAPPFLRIRVELFDAARQSSIFA